MEPDPSPSADLADGLAHAHTSTSVIKRLSEQVVNRIAAGEVIQRPSNAVKELLENALDAQATRIIVSAKEGGLKLLQMQDNGTGIRYGDLPLLCERHTTSKLNTVEELQSIGTFGFRGEALASISHASHLSVVTKVRGETHGWKAAYSDGKLIPWRPGDPPQARPAASNDGTLIQVDDLFFNMPTRRKAIGRAGDEYQKLLDVVSKYAIHHSGISMVCKKVGGKTPDLSTTPDANVTDNIGQVYGDPIQRELIALNVPYNEDYGFSASGYVTSIHYSASKGTFVFFINNRLVDCVPLKKGFEAFYSTQLPKGGQPFVYLSLNIALDKIDVNVHPTKSEVLFEDQDEIVQVIVEALGVALAAQATSRKFDSSKPWQTVTLLKPTAGAPKPSSSNSAHKPPPQKLVRTDAMARTLQEMYGFEASQTPNTTGAGKERRVIDLTDDNAQMTLRAAPDRPQTKSKKSLKLSNCNLSSIRELRASLHENEHSTLTQIFANHTFVGLIGADQPYSAIQHEVGLYLIHHDAFAEELFYQLGLRQFGKMPKLFLEPAPRIADLVQIVAESAPEHLQGMEPVDAPDEITKIWIGKRELLEEYFKLEITEDGVLKAVPLLLPGYQPVFNRLPLFLIQAALQTDWEREKACFDTFLRQLARFYLPAALARPNTDEQQWQVQHVIFPALKQYLVAPAHLVSKDNVLQLASLERLYRTFERC